MGSTGDIVASHRIITKSRNFANHRPSDPRPLGKGRSPRFACSGVQVSRGLLPATSPRPTPSLRPYDVTYVTAADTTYDGGRDCRPLPRCAPAAPGGGRGHGADPDPRRPDHRGRPGPPRSAGGGVRQRAAAAHLARQPAGPRPGRPGAGRFRGSGHGGGLPAVGRPRTGPQRRRVAAHRARRRPRRPATPGRRRGPGAAGRRRPGRAVRTVPVRPGRRPGRCRRPAVRRGLPGPRRRARRDHGRRAAAAGQHDRGRAGADRGRPHDAARTGPRDRLRAQDRRSPSVRWASTPASWCRSAS